MLGMAACDSPAIPFPACAFVPGSR
jgi:hypothetical protein